jgi:hypothetical protein
MPNIKKLNMYKKMIALYKHIWKITVYHEYINNKSMNMFKKYIIPLLTIFFLLNNINFAQGISRSSGIGVRWSIWKPHNIGSHVYVGPFPVIATVGSGEGGYLYYFTRLKENWYLETMFGGTGNVIYSRVGPFGTYTAEMSVTPLLFGARNDFLSLEHGSIFQPYWSFGGGLHWISEIKSSTVAGVNAKVGSDAQIGVYIGTGVNALLSSRFALNADFKYHLLEFNPEREYSGFEYSFGITYMWGDNPEIFRIEDIKVIVQDIYPSYYQFYNTYPLALLTVKNMVSYPIEVNIITNIQGFSERSQESGFKKINPGQTEDIPVYALFGTNLLYTKQREEAIIDIQLEARAGATQSKTISANIVIHSRNAWNGEINRLKYFLTPDDEEIIDISRQILENNPINEGSNIKNFEIAKTLFNALVDSGMRYLSDPNIPFYKDDYVQYASETIKKKTGDCDDLVILYGSLLESVGIKSAFVEVRDPEKEIAHLYLIFDTGVSQENSQQVSSNDKSYIVRNNKIWIPVETTLLQNDFNNAWKTAALNYLQQGVLRNGLTQGWVNIIDIH